MTDGGGHGYQRAMILFAALKVGVFRGLAARGCDASTLARRVGADPGSFPSSSMRWQPWGWSGKEGRHTGMRRSCGNSCSRGPFNGIHPPPPPRRVGEWAAFPQRSGGRILAGVRRETGRRTSSGGWRKTPASGRRPWSDGSRSGRGIASSTSAVAGTYAVAWPTPARARRSRSSTRRRRCGSREDLREKEAEGRVRLMEGTSSRIPGRSVRLRVDLPDPARLHRVGLREAAAPGALPSRPGRAGGDPGVPACGGEDLPPGPVFFSVHMVAVTEGDGRTRPGRSRR